MIGVDANGSAEGLFPHSGDLDFDTCKSDRYEGGQKIRSGSIGCDCLQLKQKIELLHGTVKTCEPSAPLNLERTMAAFVGPMKCQLKGV